MRRRSIPFAQRDVTRALRGAVAAGVTVKRVEINSEGTIVVVIGESAKEAEEQELDREVAEFIARHERLEKENPKRRKERK